MTNTGTASRTITLVCRSERIADAAVASARCVASQKFGKVTFLPEPVEFARVAAFARVLVLTDRALVCES